MANFTRLRAPGLWILGSVVLPEEFEAMDAIRPKLINAANGSTHAPDTIQIEIGGLGMRVSGPSRLDALSIGVLASGGTLTVANNSTLIVSNGAVGGMIRVDGGVTVPGLIKLNGGSSELRVESGSFIQVKVGGSLDIRGACHIYDGAAVTVDGGSLLTQAFGASWTMNGTFNFGNSTWPLLAPNRTWERHSLTIASTSYVGVTGTNTPGSGAPDPEAMKVHSNAAGGIDTIYVRPTDQTDRYTEVEFHNLPDGGSITSMSISTQGISATGSTVLPSYEIFRQKFASAAESMSASTPDVHTTGNFVSSFLTTSITVTAHTTISRDYRYFLRVNHAYNVSAPSGSMRIYDVRADGSSARLGLG